MRPKKPQASNPATGSPTSNGSTSPKPSASPEELAQIALKLQTQVRTSGKASTRDPRFPLQKEQAQKQKEREKRAAAVIVERVEQAYESARKSAQPVEAAYQALRQKNEALRALVDQKTGGSTAKQIKLQEPKYLDRLSSKLAEFHQTAPKQTDITVLGRNHDGFTNMIISCSNNYTTAVKSLTKAIDALTAILNEDRSPSFVEAHPHLLAEFLKLVDSLTLENGADLIKRASLLEKEIQEADKRKAAFEEAKAAVAALSIDQKKLSCDLVKRLSGKKNNLQLSLDEYKHKRPPEVLVSNRIRDAAHDLEKEIAAAIQAETLTREKEKRAKEARRAALVAAETAIGKLNLDGFPEDLDTVSNAKKATSKKKSPLAPARQNSTKTALENEISALQKKLAQKRATGTVNDFENIARDANTLAEKIEAARREAEQRYRAQQQDIADAAVTTLLADEPLMRKKVIQGEESELSLIRAAAAEQLANLRREEEEKRQRSLQQEAERLREIEEQERHKLEILTAALEAAEAVNREREAQNEQNERKTLPEFVPPTLRPPTPQAEDDVVVSAETSPLVTPRQDLRERPVVELRGSSFYDDYATEEEKTAIAFEASNSFERARFTESSHDQETTSEASFDPSENRRTVFSPKRDLERKPQTSRTENTTQFHLEAEAIVEEESGERKISRRDVTVTREAKRSRGGEVEWNADVDDWKEKCDLIAKKSLMFRVAEHAALVKKIESLTLEVRAASLTSNSASESSELEEKGNLLAELNQLKDHFKPNVIVIDVDDSERPTKHVYIRGVERFEFEATSKQFDALEAHLKYYEKVIFNGIEFDHSNRLEKGRGRDLGGSPGSNRYSTFGGLKTSRDDVSSLSSDSSVRPPQSK